MPKNDPKVVKVVTSGVPELYSDVDIYDSALEHVGEHHPEELSRIDDVYQTIENPDLVLQSRTKPDNTVLLVNVNCVSTGGDHLHVPIKNVKPGESIMTTAYFAKPGTKGKVIWKKPAKKKAKAKTKAKK